MPYCRLKHDTWKKLDIKDHIWHVSIYFMFLSEMCKIGKFVDIKSFGGEGSGQGD